MELIEGLGSETALDLTNSYLIRYALNTNSVNLNLNSFRLKIKDLQVLSTGLHTGS